MSRIKVCSRCPSPATPESLVFAHQATHASITAVLWQQIEDVMLIAVTVAVR